MRYDDHKLRELLKDLIPKIQIDDYLQRRYNEMAQSEYEFKSIENEFDFGSDIQQSVAAMFDEVASIPSCNPNLVLKPLEDIELDSVSGEAQDVSGWNPSMIGEIATQKALDNRKPSDMLRDAEARMVKNWKGYQIDESKPISELQWYNDSYEDKIYQRYYGVRPKPVDDPPFYGYYKENASTGEIEVVGGKNRTMIIAHELEKMYSSKPFIKGG